VKVRITTIDGKTELSTLDIPAPIPDVIVWGERYFVFVRDNWFREALVAFVRKDKTIGG
jgi:hypothetical protein